MPVTVHTNVSSLDAQKNLNKTVAAVAKSVSKLSSGLRITSAADDAAGLAISEEMRADIRSYQQANRNASDGVSLLRTAEGGMSDITGMLQRMRELAMQSASDGVTDTQRGYINDEVVELQGEIDRIASDTQFNGVNLLDGSLDVEFQVGLDTGDTIDVALGTNVNAAGLGVAAATVNLSSQGGADSALAAIDGALGTLSGFRAQIGAQENRFDVVKSNLTNMYENLSAAESSIRDVDVAEEMSKLTRSQILMQAGASMLSQANSTPQIALSLLG